MTRTLRIGTRGSPLALVQAGWVAARLAEHQIPTELVVIRTEGDDRPVDTAWGEGAFVGRIVAALLERAVDLAVHSAKDVPTDEAPGLVIAAYPRREDPRDALVCRVRGTTVATLPGGARVGTDSPRRVAFLRAVRPDLQLHALHGNVDTRLAKLDRGDSDALVLAVAGLARLGRADRIDEILPAGLVTPAPGQGSLALQVRADDAEAIDAVRVLDDTATRVAVQAERALLNGTGGGCRSPIGALGRVTDDGILELVAAAERSWIPAPAAALASTVTPIIRFRGRAAVDGRAALASRLARRIVTLRDRPRVLTLRAAAQADALLAALEAAGVDAANVPAIEILTEPAGGALDAALAAAEPGQRIVLTSANGARAVVEGLERLTIPAGRHAWAATGDATRAVLAAAGADDVFVPTEANGASLAAELPLEPGDPILLARGDIADPALPETLRSRGATVTEVVAYRTVEGPVASRPLLAAALDDGPVDALVVSSGSAARGLLTLAADDVTAARLRAIPVIAIGQPSTAVARTAGFATVITAPSPEPRALAGFVAASLGAAAAANAAPDADTATTFTPSAVPAGGSR
ncbi:MAG TPA: hydroxymethylbilane synthase [Candidatus Limnocylindrales bacterium]|nr:hydroxymethylbilane synthase [Candidatus Limnocylindrales bacterium]